MDKLLKTELIILMNKSSQEITNEKMQRAYGEFIAHIDNVRFEYEKVI
ncbi:hypothetical protein PSM36_2826 [Proteiniphilum saccharofermentans]|uniref:Uncharacterized protein n=1 Tax=Proteiniphilum saccharofermentans TaxID=1642647 RepID=A0A1R3T1K8_9BACT|nr:hypothetical protein [Proteiniphilum saccharofermentans]SCD21621.1 hypothetical protein PSM36_2826 [Proteiniphilum saccharofermentans]